MDQNNSVHSLLIGQKNCCALNFIQSFISVYWIKHYIKTIETFINLACSWVGRFSSFFTSSSQSRKLKYEGGGGERNAHLYTIQRFWILILISESHSRLVQTEVSESVLLLYSVHCTYTGLQSGFYVYNPYFSRVPAVQ